MLHPAIVLISTRNGNDVEPDGQVNAIGLDIPVGGKCYVLDFPSVYSLFR